MPPTTTTPYDGVIDAMRSVQTESDRWTLAEALQKAVPTGVKGFNEIMDAASNAGVGASLSVHTLRLYRDAAVRWPASKRVANVSFSAHREAMVLPDIAAAVKMLDDLVKQHGANKVTISEVRKAVAIKQGKPAPGGQSKQKAAAAQQAQFDVLADLRRGAPALIKQINASTSGTVLDEVHAGLTKALGHVERLQSKQRARSKQPSKPKPAAPAAQPKPTNGKSTPKKAQGDLRGL